MRRATLAATTVVGIGVAVVGVVRRSDGMVALAPNLGWRDEPLGERLADALGAACPDHVRERVRSRRPLPSIGAGPRVGVDDVLFIWGSVGVGGGLDRRRRAAHRRRPGYSGEVGHIPVNPDGSPCRCGSIGCWETEVGMSALLRRAGPAGRRAAHDAVDAILRDAEAGEPAALAALSRRGRWLGIGLAGVINVLNPDLVLLGGRFAPAYPFVRSTLEAELDRRVLRASRRSSGSSRPPLGEDAPLVGAAELAFEPLLADPAAWLRPRRTLAALASA